MQQLMEQNPLPMLLMRTVIQSLTMYPRLVGFVMNILSRLIVKQVSSKQANNNTVNVLFSLILKLYFKDSFFVYNQIECMMSRQSENLAVIVHKWKVLSSCFYPPGVEVSQGMGRIREVLPEDKASVLQRAPSAAASAANAGLWTLSGTEGASSAARPLFHPSSGQSCFHIDATWFLFGCDICWEIPHEPTVFSLKQQAHIPSSIMVVLEANKKPEPQPLDQVEEKQVPDDNSADIFLVWLMRQMYWGFWVHVNFF